jgi:TetR/AcrR family fatty acid metabolism transcriptional regulator
MASVDTRERRREILRAAIRVFARNGYHDSRVGEVATEAGVAYGLVYHYFASKGTLLQTIVHRTWTRLLEAVERVEEENAPAPDQLRAIAGVVLDTWRTDPDLVRVLVREITRTPQLQQEVDEIGQAFAALERVVARGQQRGELRTDIAPRLAAWVFYGALEEILTGWVFERLPDGEEDVEAARHAVAAMLLDGLAARKSDDNLAAAIRRN